MVRLRFRRRGGRRFRVAPVAHPMIIALPDRTYSGPEVVHLAGYAHVSALHAGRIGGLLGLTSPGSGNYHRLTAREALAACVVSDILDPHVNQSSVRARRVAEAILPCDDLCEWLVVTDRTAYWTDDPAEAVLVAGDDTPHTASVVCVRSYLDRLR